MPKPTASPEKLRRLVAELKSRGGVFVPTRVLRDALGLRTDDALYGVVFAASCSGYPVWGRSGCGYTLSARPVSLRPTVWRAHRASRPVSPAEGRLVSVLEQHGGVGLTAEDLADLVGSGRKVVQKRLKVLVSKGFDVRVLRTQYYLG